MLTGKYRRIYHYHLKKCGGSTLNYWLDTLTCDERTSNVAGWHGFCVTETKSDETGETFEMVVPSLVRTLFHWSDVICSHGPLRMYAPENTFCFTVLRDPVQRLVSQVSDFRRLSDTDTIDSSANVRACVEDSRHMSLPDLLKKHGQRGGREFLDNYMTRSLAAGRFGQLSRAGMAPAELCEVALQSLEEDYDLIGLTENMSLSRNALCAMVGLPRARKIPTINAAPRVGCTDLELSDARDILQSLTDVDRVVYDRACQLFDRRHRQAAEAYDTASFETLHAAPLLAQARGYFRDGATRYSVRAPIVGSGFHGRDGAGMPSCAVWSGPETRMTLYIPTPSDMPLSLLVWIRGYVDIRQRDQLRVWVDGRPAVHQFEYAEDYADLLRVDTYASKDFVRIEIDIGVTLESGDPGSELHDSRRLGLAFDSYGWRPVC
jgi:hypothetical protein